MNGPGTGLGFRCWQFLGTKSKILFQSDCAEEEAERRRPWEAAKAVLFSLWHEVSAEAENLGRKA